MAAFRFRLQSVLEYRRRLVDISSQALSTAEARVREVAASMAEARSELAAIENPARPGASLEVLRLKDATDWYEFLARRLESLNLAHQEAAAEADRCRDDLRRAWRDREVLERLRVRRRDEWRQREDKREISELDEIGQQRASRAGTRIAL